MTADSRETPCGACRERIGNAGCFIAPGIGFCANHALFVLNVLQDWKERMTG